MSQELSKNSTLEATNNSHKEDNFPYIPVSLLILFLATTYFAYIRSYVRDDIYYFTTEEEVDSFDPLSFLHGNN